MLRRLPTPRHIEKTGGTSLRDSFKRSACQFFGYQMYSSTMHRIETFLNNYSHYVGRPRWRYETANTHSNVTACVEAHSPTPALEEFAPLVSVLQRSARVVLLMLVRRPDEHYISFFRWTHQPSRNDTRETYSAKLLLWRPRDLQTYMLWNLHHSKRASMAGRAWVGDPFASLAEPLRCGPIIALAAGFHVFDLAADFDGTLRSIRDLTGLQLPPHRNTPSMLYGWPPAPPITLPLIQEAHGVNFTHRVRQLAPCDWQLYALSRRGLGEVRR